jgi:hypothetical protein
MKPSAAPANLLYSVYLSRQFSFANLAVGSVALLHAKQVAYNICYSVSQRHASGFFAVHANEGRF